jgi:putative transposase
LHAELQESGERIGDKQFCRLMKSLGIVVRAVEREDRRPPRGNPDARPAADLVDRDFSADGPDELWRHTYIPTWTAVCSWPSCSMPVAVA